MEVTSCNFRNCSSGEFAGGASFLDVKESTVQSCLFVNCHALIGSGGAIDLLEDNAVVPPMISSIFNTHFEDCSATDTGGAVNFERKFVRLTLV